MSFTPNIPVSGQSLGQTRQAILDNFAILRSSLAVDHVDVNASGNGKHKYVHFTDQSSSIPSTAANELVLFNKLVSGAARIFLRQPNNGTQIQMTGRDPTVSINGETFLPGGLLMKWGRVTGLSGSWPTSDQTLSYSSAFPTATLAVFTSFIGPTSSSSGDITINAINAANFHWQFSGSSSTSFGGFYWLALGD